MRNGPGTSFKRGGFEHLCLPTCYESERAYRTGIGWCDPRRETGELLFPEMFPPEVIQEEETRMGPLAFAGQHQQNPTSIAGNLFKAELFCPDARGKSYWAYPDKKIEEAYFSWDTATKAKAYKAKIYNDFTAGCLVMQAKGGYVYVVPVVLDRMEIPKVVKTIALQWARWKQRLGQNLDGCKIEEGARTAVV